MNALKEIENVDNVVKMRDESKNISLYDYKVFEKFTSWLKVKELKSSNTSKNYATSVKGFFESVLGKDVMHISMEELHSITYDDVLNYIEDKKSVNKFSTLKTKLKSVKSFYSYINKTSDNAKLLNVDILDVDMPKDSKHHEVIVSTDELVTFLNALKELEDGHEKYLLAKTLFVTANRLSATLNMKWSNIVEITSGTGEKVRVVKVEDKGGKITDKPISNTFYNELLTLKKENVDNVFSLTERQFRYALSKLGNIVPHGLKGSSLTQAYMITKDIKRVQQLGSHSNVKTLEHYVRQTDVSEDKLSYMMDNVCNESMSDDERVFNSMTKQELIKLITSNEKIKETLLSMANKGENKNET